MKPQRIKRERVTGWRMPENTVYVGRPSRWGNPFRYRTYAGLARVPAIDGSPWEYEGRISADGARHDYHHPDGHVTEHRIRYMTRAECVEVYERALLTPTPQMHLWLQMERRWLTVADVRSLAGKNLACWCPIGEACHAEVLLRIANSGGDAA